MRIDTHRDGQRDRQTNTRSLSDTEYQSIVAFHDVLEKFHDDQTFKLDLLLKRGVTHHGSCADETVVLFLVSGCITTV